VLKPEVDAAGYDLVLSLGKVIRHVQLKTSMLGGKTARQPIQESLGTHPSGCVVWIVLNEDLTFDHFRWLGGEAGQPLTDLTHFKRAKHSRANAQGVKKERVQTRTVPQKAFQTLPDMAALVEALFGVTLRLG
jgi:hypothetical protein